MKRLLLFLISIAAAIPAFAQTTVYLPAVGATSCQVTAASNATPSIVTCANHGWVAGQVIAIFSGYGGDWTAGWVVNGLRKVANPVTTNTFAITDIGNTNIVGPSSFACASQGGPTVTNRLGCRAVALTSYTTQTHPRVFGLDGGSGTLSTALKDTSGTGRANTANVPWQALQDIETNFASTAPTPDPENTQAWAALTALDWWANSGSTQLTNSKAAVVTNPLDAIRGSAGCITSISYCNRPFDTDYASFYFMNVMLDYSIIRSQLTSGQRTVFANQMLNDNTHAADGIDSSACTNQGMTSETGTLSSSGTAVTGSGTTFTSYSVGDTLMLASPNDSDTSFRIVSITDNTHLVASISQSFGLAAFYRSPLWTTGNCGAVWFMKHHQASPFSDPTNYPFSGGNGFGGEGNLALTKVLGYVQIGLALADDDPRAVELLALSSAYFYDQQLYPAKQMWTGFSETAPYYWWGRVTTYAANIALTIKDGLVSGPDYTQGIWLSRSMSLPYYLAYPGQSENTMTYGEGADATTNTDNSPPWSLLPYMYPSAPEAGYVTYWLRNASFKNAWTTSYLEVSHGEQLVYHYLFGAPSATQTALSGAPAQYVYKDTDYAQCATFGYTCSSTKMYGFMTSLTSATAATATQLLYESPDFYAGDHATWYSSGDPHIVRNQNILLGGDNTYGQSGGCCGTGTGIGEQMPELAGQANFLSTNIYQASPIIRWAGVDPTGDASNRYAYAMSDLSGTYSAGVTRAQEHIAHFKASGAQDYIVEYQDLALSSPSTIKRYIHAFINGGTLPGGVTYTSGTDSLASVQSAAKLNTFVLFPGATGTTLVDNSDGSYTNGFGFSFRLTVCAGSAHSCNGSASSGKWIIVHEPINGTSGSMPTLTQPTATGTGTNFDAVQIADGTMPKVAAFAQSGLTATSLSMTTTHSGTAQYLVAGMSPGTYTVTVGGTPVSGSPFSVYAGDNTIYWESGSGAVQVGNATIMNTFIGIPVFGGVIVK